MTLDASQLMNRDNPFVNLASSVESSAIYAEKAAKHIVFRYPVSSKKKLLE
jgi:hypothetical protein